MSSKRKAGCADGNCETKCDRGCVSFRDRNYINESESEVFVTCPKPKAKKRKIQCESESTEEPIKLIKRSKFVGSGVLSIGDAPLTQAVLVNTGAGTPPPTATITFPALLSSLRVLCGNKVTTEVGQSCKNTANVLASTTVTIQYTLWPFAALTPADPTVFTDLSPFNPTLASTVYTTTVESFDPSIIQVIDRRISKCDNFEVKCAEACLIRELPDIETVVVGADPAAGVPGVSYLIASSISLQFSVTVQLYGWKKKQPGKPCIKSTCPVILPTTGVSPIELTLSGTNLFGIAYLNGFPLATVPCKTQKPCSITVTLPFTGDAAATLTNSFCLTVINPDGSESNSVPIGRSLILQAN